MQTALLIAAAAVFISSAAASAYMLLRPKGQTVEIISGSSVLYTLDLSKEPDREITVEYEGRKNIIKIEDHDIYMLEAECPDHTCIKTGRLSKAGVPIVCLPNKLMIRYKNGAGGDTDAAA
jgi:hypothetical protein